MEQIGTRSPRGTASIPVRCPSDHEARPLAQDPGAARPALGPPALNCDGPAEICKHEAPLREAGAAVHVAVEQRERQGGAEAV